MGKMSNRDRIALKALEAEATQKEKVRAKAAPAKKPARRTTKKAAAAPSGRTRVGWIVCDRSGSEVTMIEGLGFA